MTKTSSGFDVRSALQRINMRDFLVNTETAESVLSDLTQYSEAILDPSRHEALEVTSREKLEMAYGYESDKDDRKPFVYSDGIAVIPIHGTLINRFNSCWGFVTGYNFIRRMMNLALDDDDVQIIVFDIDSPGGEASGCFELAREIMQSRRVKASLAMVDSLACSGGYALGVGPTQMYAIPSARIGSIGVYRMHVSIEEALKNEGVKITFATAGEHKIDGNPYQDLPQSVLDEWRESAGKTWDDFISLVAEAREIPETSVRGTQARVYRADEALALGLIDAVRTPTDAISAFVAELGNDEPESEDEHMEKPNKTEVTSVATVDPAVIAAAVASAMTTERQRTASILSCDEAKGRQKLAQHIATATSLSLDEAKVLLGNAALEGKAPKAEGKQRRERADEGDDDDNGPEDEDEDNQSDNEDEDNKGEQGGSRRQRERAKGGRGRDKINHFNRAMGRERHPNVGAGNERRGRQDEDPTPEDQAGALLADHHAATGANWSKKAANGN